MNRLQIVKELDAESIQNVSIPYTPLERIEQKVSIEKALERLPIKHARVLKMRYGLDGEPPLTCREVGEYLGVTRGRINDIEKKAIRVLQRPWLKKMLR